MCTFASLFLGLWYQGIGLALCTSWGFALTSELRGHSTQLFCGLFTEVLRTFCRDFIQSLEVGTSAVLCSAFVEVIQVLPHCRTWVTTEDTSLFTFDICS